MRSLKSLDDSSSDVDSFVSALSVSLLIVNKDVLCH